MLPILFRLGPLTIYTYGVLVAVGVIGALWYARRQAPRAGLNPEHVWNLGIYMVLVALILAKIWLVVTAWHYYQANPREIFSIQTIQSGGTFYGGIIGAIATIVLYTSFQKMPLFWQAHGASLGRPVYKPSGGAARRNSARHSAPSDAAL